METYTIEGLDCTQCASDIEGALQKNEGIEGATVNFAAQTVRLPEGTLQRAQEIVRRVEPEARIVDFREETHAEGDAAERSGNGLRLLRLVAAVLLGGFGMLFRTPLQATAFNWAEYAVFLSAYLLVGWSVLAGAVRTILRGRVFEEMFLMSVATVAAIAVHQLPEAVAVMLFYTIGEHFQERAVDSSRRSISSLMDLRPEFARLVTAEGPQELEPGAVEVGATIEVLPGERIPLDGEITAGESAVDTSALTGESVPRSVAPGDAVLSGFVNGAGKVRLRVTKSFAESSVSRILELVENAASRKAPTERFISRFAGVYTPVMVSLAAAIAVLPPLLLPGALFGEWVYRAAVLLVISCPCALVISIPLGYFGGIGGASRNSILIKGANFVDVLKDVSTVVLDKTGTLTQGVFRVTRTVPRNGYTEKEVLRWAACAESHSTHPIARSIREAYGAVNPEEVSAVQEEKGYGITAMVGGRRVTAGSDKLLHREQIEHTDCEAEGTVVYVAVDGVYLGYLLIADEVKPEAREAIAALKEYGVEQIVMLTGDNHNIAQQVARELGIDRYYAELLPQDKVTRVEEMERELPRGKRLAFAGDGINDAPVLMRSDVGFAMGALGSDAALEAADVVLMDDRVDRIPAALGIAHFTRKVVMQNILLALLVKAVFLALGAFGFATMWEAVIADVGVALLAVLNATRTLRFSSGRDEAGHAQPERSAGQTNTVST